MRHRKTLANDFASVDVDDNSAIGPMVAPPVKGVASGNTRHILRPAVADGDAVQMAAILSRQAADEWRLPNRAKTVGLRNTGDAIEPRVGECDVAVLEGHDVMNVQIASEVRHLRDVKCIGAVGRPRYILHRVTETIDLGVSRYPEVRAGNCQTKTAPDIAIEDPKLSVRLSAEEEYLPQLIGGERKACITGLEPGFKSAAGIQLENRPLRRPLRWNGR